MCGASSEQYGIQDAQIAFTKLLTSQYQTIFGESQDILGKLTDVFKPILEAGPNQHGFNEEERTALNSQATEGVARNYGVARRALADQAAALGGDSFTPSGATSDLFSSLDEAAAEQKSKEELAITSADYDTGRSNFFSAASELNNEAGLLDPSRFSGEVTNSGSAAATTANQITQANNSWLGPVLGAVGGIAGAAAGNPSFHF